MSETDAFFTQTIVGAPLSVLLGRQTRPLDDQAIEGLQIGLDGETESLSPSWRSWIITTQACAPVGIPRMRPNRLRRWLERYALVIASLGLLSWLAGGMYWSMMRWS
jgi:hypothetical protein